MGKAINFASNKKQTNMKMKNILLTIAATLGMTALTMAQNVPSYVPTNGLVAWWPFNGNANDESGNENHGTVFGATLTEDRAGNVNSAMEFNGINNYISIPYSNTIGVQQEITVSFWVYFNGGSCGPRIMQSMPWGQCGGYTIATSSGSNSSRYFYTDFNNCSSSVLSSSSPDINGLICKHINWSASGLTGISTMYFDGVLVDSDTTNNYFNSVNYSNNPLTIGNIDPNSCDWFGGYLDDIAIYNRTLTQQEITELFNETNCGNNTTINPQTNALNTGNTATFTASTTDANPNYFWQSDFGQGYQNLNDFGNYSGTNTAILNIANVQLANHNQPIRVITTSGECIDTSNVAIISIADTCINTITDTTLITVTDTLVINSTITSLSPPNNSNTIKVFPNPTNDHITIDYGNFSIMSGYQLQIENSLVQQVFQTDITQQSDYLNLSNWGANGLYFVQIIDPQGNTIDIRKIVLQ
jgi:hypothetical protein